MENKSDILVVDDEIDIRESMADILKEIGYKVDCAANGKEAIEKVKNRLYKVVLLYIRMPGIDGVEALKQIWDLNQDVKAIFITAYMNPEKKEEIENEKVIDILYKPIEIEKLIELLKEHV
ncbi:MAG: response regulator [Promethearchaeota archaeon]